MYHYKVWGVRTIKKVMTEERSIKFILGKYFVHDILVNKTSCIETYTKEIYTPWKFPTESPLLLLKLSYSLTIISAPRKN